MRYLGSKGGNGVCQFLINNIPAHEYYQELCAGSAKLFRKKRPASNNWLNDINPKTVKQLIESLGPELNCKADTITNYNFLSILGTFNYEVPTFIYIDPPYPESARRDFKGTKYEFDFTHEQQVEFLTFIQDFQSAFVMISTRPNELYSSYLSNWRFKDFQTSDHGGKCIERIYMNYPEPTLLHEYTYLGENFTDRQRIGRKVKRQVDKLVNLPLHERNALLANIAKTFPKELQAFSQKSGLSGI